MAWTRATSGLRMRRGPRSSPRPAPCGYRAPQRHRASGRRSAPDEARRSGASQPGSRTGTRDAASAGMAAACFGTSGLSPARRSGRDDIDVAGAFHLAVQRGAAQPLPESDTRLQAMELHGSPKCRLGATAGGRLGVGPRRQPQGSCDRCPSRAAAAAAEGARESLAGAVQELHENVRRFIERARPRTSFESQAPGD